MASILNVLLIYSLFKLIPEIGKTWCRFFNNVIVNDVDFVSYFFPQCSNCSPTRTLLSISMVLRDLNETGVEVFSIVTSRKDNNKNDFKNTFRLKNGKS